MLSLISKISKTLFSMSRQIYSLKATQRRFFRSLEIQYKAQREEVDHVHHRITNRAKRNITKGIYKYFL